MPKKPVAEGKNCLLGLFGGSKLFWDRGPIKRQKGGDFADFAPKVGKSFYSDLLKIAFSKFPMRAKRQFDPRFQGKTPEKAIPLSHERAPNFYWRERLTFALIFPRLKANLTCFRRPA